MPRCNIGFTPWRVGLNTRTRATGLHRLEARRRPSRTDFRKVLADPTNPERWPHPSATRRRSSPLRLGVIARARPTVPLSPQAIRRAISRLSPPETLPMAAPPLPLFRWRKGGRPHPTLGRRCAPAAGTRIGRRRIRLRGLGVTSTRRYKPRRAKREPTTNDDMRRDGKTWNAKIESATTPRAHAQQRVVSHHCRRGLAPLPTNQSGLLANLVHTGGVSRRTTIRNVASSPRVSTRPSCSGCSTMAWLPISANPKARTMQASCCNSTLLYGCRSMIRRRLRQPAEVCMRQCKPNCIPLQASAGGA